MEIQALRVLWVDIIAITSIEVGTITLESAQNGGVLPL